MSNNAYFVWEQFKARVIANTWRISMGSEQWPVYWGNIWTSCLLIDMLHIVRDARMLAVISVVGKWQIRTRVA